MRRTGCRSPLATHMPTWVALASFSESPQHLACRVLCGPRDVWTAPRTQGPSTGGAVFTPGGGTATRGNDRVGREMDRWKKGPKKKILGYAFDLTKYVETARVLMVLNFPPVLPAGSCQSLGLLGCARGSPGPTEFLNAVECQGPGL